jgi:pyruvate/2-oxoglutarate dehydrogenase complex dihydrolipoamide acyltransferase (E2) component
MQITLAANETAHDIDILDEAGPRTLTVQPGESAEVPEAVARALAHNHPDRWTADGDIGDAPPEPVVLTDDGDELDALTRPELKQRLVELGIDAPTEGSGVDGRVVKADLVAAIRSAPQQPSA